MKVIRLVRHVPSALGIIAFVVAIGDQLRRSPEERTWRGTVGFIPYDFRVPNVDRVLSRVWNTDDPRIFTPQIFGVGWTINWYQVAKNVSPRSG
jgi:hypothetical protein